MAQGHVPKVLQDEIDAHEGLINGMAGTLKIYAEKFPGDCPDYETRLLAPLAIDRRQMFLVCAQSPMVTSTLEKHNSLVRANCP
jgi:hypothetical protein